MAAAVSTWRVMVQFGAQNLTGAAFTSLMSEVSRAEMHANRLNSALHNVSSTVSMLQIAGGTALMGFGRAAIGVFEQMIQKAGDFQIKMVMLQQAIGDPSKIGYDKYNLGLRNLANQRMDLMVGSNPTIFGIEQLTDVQRMLLQTGFTPDQITRAGRGGHTLGQGVSYMGEKEQLRELVTNPAQTAQNVAQFLKAYGLEGDAAYSAINTLAKVQTQTGHFSSQDLKTYEQYFGNLARSVGMKPEDMIILSGFMSRMGMTSSSGATSLNNLFLQSLDPTKGQSNFESSKRLEAAMGLGMLGRVNPAQARAAIAAQIKGFQDIGVPMDPSQWTVAMQDRVARSALISTAPNMLLHDYREGLKSGNGLAGIDKFFNDARTRLISSYGQERGQDMMAVYLARLLNLRGARAGLTLDARDPAAYSKLSDDEKKLGGPSALSAYVKSVNNQQDIDTLIAQARNTLHGQEATSSNRFNAIMLQLAGVDMATGKARAGGAMDTVLQLLKHLNNFMAEIVKFNNAHPGAAAAMGNAIGIFGVVASLVGALLVGAGTLGLLRAGLGPGGGAMLKAAGGRMVSGLGFLNPANVLKDAGWLIDHAAYNTMDWWHAGQYGSAIGPRIGMQPGRSFVGTVGSAIGNMFSRIPGLSSISGILGRLGLGFGGFARVLGLVLPKLLGFVGWITLAIDALSFFSKHPKDIGTWIGYVLKFFRDTLIPGVKNIFGMVVQYILDELGKLWDMVTHLNQIPQWFDQVNKSIQGVLNDSPNTGTKNVTKQGPLGHAPGTNHHAVNVSVNVALPPGTPRKHAEEIAKHVKQTLSDALYTTTGGAGIPGRPHPLTGSG